MALHAGPDEEAHLVGAASALRRAGLHTAALRRFALAAALGGRQFARATAPLLADLATPLDGDVAEALLAALPRLPVQRLTPAAVQRLRWRLAVHLLRQGAAQRAARLIGQDPGSARVLYLRGVLQVQQGRRAEAALTFSAAERSASARQVDLADLSRLARARLAAAAKRYKAAARHYRRIAYGSPHFFRARQELAWLLLAAGAPAAALAESLTLQAPELRRYYRPDGPVLEAAALLALCRGKHAAAKVATAQAELDGAIQNLVGFLRSRPEARMYYVDATASIAGRSRELMSEIGHALLADASFRRAFRQVRQLQQERLLLQRSSNASWGPIAGELDQRLVVAQQRAGHTVRRLLIAQLDELRELRRRSDEIAFELRRPTPRLLRPRAAAGAPTVRAGEVLKWPFRGEYWADEIGHYSLPLRSHCR